MARPEKPRKERRVRWDALYVTEAERAEISAAARAADLSVSRYLVGLRNGRMRNSHGEGAARLKVLRAIEAHMARIVSVLESAEPSVRLPMLANLLVIERQARVAALGRGPGVEGDPDEDAP